MVRLADVGVSNRCKVGPSCPTLHRKGKRNMKVLLRILVAVMIVAMIGLMGTALVTAGAVYGAEAAKSVYLQA